MAQYDVAVWRFSEEGWPDIVARVQAETASAAVLQVLHEHGLRRAVKVAAAARDGFIWRWWWVVCQRDRFFSQTSGRARLGVPARKASEGAAQLL